MQSPRPLLARTQREAGVHLSLTGGAGGLSQPLQVVAVGLVMRRVLCVGEFVLQRAQTGELAFPRILGLLDGLADPFGLRPRGPGQRTELGELLGHRSHRGVGLVKLRERDVYPALRLGSLFLQPGLLESQPLTSVGGLLELGRSIVHSGLHLDQAGCGRGSTGREVGSQQVTITSHRDQVRTACHQRTSSRKVVNDDDLEQQTSKCRAKLSRAIHHVDGVRRA